MLVMRFVSSRLLQQQAIQPHCRVCVKLIASVLHNMPWAILSESDSQPSSIEDAPHPQRRRGRPRKQETDLSRARRLQRESEDVELIQHDWWTIAANSDRIKDHQIHALVQRSNTTAAKPKFDKFDQQFLKHVWGKEPRPLIPCNAEAVQLKCSRDRLKTSTQLTAAATYFAHLQFIGSTISYLHQQVLDGKWEPLVAVTFIMYDDTQLKVAMRSLRKRFGVSRSKVLRVQEAQSRSVCRARDKRLNARTAKIANHDLRIAFVMLDTSTNSAVVVLLEVPTPLTAADRGTGQTTAKCLNDLIDRIPQFKTFFNIFLHRVSLFTRDRAASNLSGEGFIFSEHAVGDYNLGQFCSTHCNHTVAGSSLKAIADTVSGSIALALAQSQAGQHDILQEGLIILLLRRARPARGAIPPSYDSPSSQYRCQVLDWFESGYDKHRALGRRYALEILFPFDWQSSDIFVILPVHMPDEQVQAAMEEWAEQAAVALIPSKLDIFARHRWCVSGKFTSELLLLVCCHHLLPELIPIYLTLLGKKIPQCISSWSVLTIADEDFGDEKADESENTPASSDPQGWSKFNETQRGKTIRFGQDRFTVVGIILWHVCLSMHRSLMAHLLEVGGPSWDLQQQARVALDGSRSYRVVEAAAGRLTAIFFEEANDALFETTKWLCLPDANLTEEVQSYAFLMVAHSCGGVAMLISDVYEDYPYRLWLLIDPARSIDDVVQLILATALPCMLDEFSKVFLIQFCTSEKLRSLQCKLLLITIALLLRLDTGAHAKSRLPE
jgi:hypothetical protein